MLQNALFLQNCDVFDKRVFLRADLNVSLKNGEIRDDTRLKAIITTLEHLLDHEAKIILATHIGRPEGPENTLSTQLLIPWFIQQGYTIIFESDLGRAEMLSHEMEIGSILLLENMRFFAGEQSHSKTERTDFATNLAAMADIYVNDAFGLIHRNDTSITTLPQLFDSKKRCFGLGIRRELENLEILKKKPKKPFVCVLGGSKLETKLPLIKGLLKAPEVARPNYILIGGALAQHIGNISKHIILPSDFLTITGPLGTEPVITQASDLTNDQKPVDIGPQTIKNFSEIIATAGTIFANGTMGIYEHPQYQAGTKLIFEAIASSPAYTVIGGGDAVAAAFQFEIADKIDFISTGGGATLAYLSSQDPWNELPGLSSLR